MLKTLQLVTFVKLQKKTEQEGDGHKKDRRAEENVLQLESLRPQSVHHINSTEKSLWEGNASFREVFNLAEESKSIGLNLKPN